MLYTKTIAVKTLELLKKIAALPEMRDMRLVGGTSLALQIGHRSSVDLDFFGYISVPDYEILNLMHSISDDVKVIQDSKNIHIYSVNGIKIVIVNYSYAWLFDPIVEDGIILADKRDIAAMKIAPVTGRGTKKDFIDLACLLDYFTLKNILDWYKSKYPDAIMFTALKSLTYFDDAEDDVMPLMSIQISWSQCKEKVLQAYAQLEI